MQHQPRSASDETEEQPIKAGDTAAGGGPLLEDPERLEDPVLAEFNAERLELKRQQRDLEVRINDFPDAVKAERFSASQFLEIGKKLRIRSQELLKQKAQWQRQYVGYTKTEYPGTRHWGAHCKVDQQTLREHVKQQMESRGYIIMDMDP